MDSYHGNGAQGQMVNHDFEGGPKVTNLAPAVPKESFLLFSGTGAKASKFSYFSFACVVPARASIVSASALPTRTAAEKDNYY